MTSTITRRAFIRAAAATNAVACIAALAVVGSVSKLYGMTESGLRHRVSAKFTGPGFYAFGRTGGGDFRVFYCEKDRGGFLPGFIDLSDGAGEPLQMSLSPRCFDETCWGKCLTQAEAERRV